VERHEVPACWMSSCHVRCEFYATPWGSFHDYSQLHRLRIRTCVPKFVVEMAQPRPRLMIGGPRVRDHR
jgi:hypothetical protein